MDEGNGAFTEKMPGNPVVTCLRYRSICPRSCESVMEHSTRMALDRYKSVLLFMSFIKELVMMMTSSAPGQTSLMTKYTMRLRFASLL